MLNAIADAINLATSWTAVGREVVINGRCVHEIVVTWRPWWVTKLRKR